MERLPMRKIKDVLRLYAAGLSDRKIAVSLGVGRGSVRNYRERAKDAGLCWSDVAEVDDAVLERQLFTQTTVSDAPRFCEYNWGQISSELKNRGGSLHVHWGA